MSKNPPSPVAEGHKHCFKCSTVKPETEFYLSSRRDRPNMRTQEWCKSCRKAYYSTPEWRERFNDYQRKAREKKRRIVQGWKAETGCVDCGESHVACLEYHHLDPSQKEFTISGKKHSNTTVARIAAEAAKCIVLCANCHKKRHYNEREAHKANSA